jgi:hypothetical protein
VKNFLRQMVAQFTESGAATHLLPFETRLDAQRSIRNS